MSLLIIDATSPLSPPPSPPFPLLLCLLDQDLSRTHGAIDALQFQGALARCHLKHVQTGSEEMRQIAVVVVVDVFTAALWSKIEKNTDKIAIQ